VLLGQQVLRLIPLRHTARHAHAMVDDGFRRA